MSKFKRLLRPRNLIIFFLVFTFLVIISGVVFTIAGGTREYYKITPGLPQSAFDSLAVGAGGTCYVMTNNSGVDYFVPTKTAHEYNLFVAAAPRLNVALSPCQYCGDSSCTGTENCYSCAYDCGGCYTGCCLLHPTSCGTNKSAEECADHLACHWDTSAQVCAWTEGICETVDAPQATCEEYGCRWNTDARCTGIISGCVPSCSGKSCGSNGCGGSCGTCPANASCSNGVCLTLCGNGYCSGSENCNNCSSDCGICQACFVDSDCTSYGGSCNGAVMGCTGKFYCVDYENDEWGCKSVGGCIWKPVVSGVCY